MLADRGSDPFGRQLRLAGGAAGEDDGELVAAEPGQGVAGAAAPAQDVGHFSDQLVAGGVTVGVVDLLEVIEVEHQDGAGGALAPRPRHRDLQVFVEAAAVLQAGQRVLACLALQLLHALLAAPDEDQGAEQGSDRDADPGQHQRQADVGALRVADDQRPGAVGDLQRCAGRALEFAPGPDNGSPVDPQLDRIGVGDRADRRGGEVGDLEAAAGEADQGGTSLGDGVDRGAVAVDGAEDVDPAASDQQRHDPGGRRPAGVAGTAQIWVPQRIAGQVEAEAPIRRQIGDGVGEREVDRGVGGSDQAPGRPAAFDDVEAVAAFEARSVRGRDPLDEGGRVQCTLVEKRAGDDVELVLADALVYLEERRGVGELADRESRHRLGLVGGAVRLVLLHRVEIGAVIGVDRKRHGHRADGDDSHRGEADPEAKSHIGLVGRSAPSIEPGTRNAHVQASGAAASDSQR